MATGTVREWHDERGWGVLDSDRTPGGCWFHFSALAVDGHRRADVGDRVRFVWEATAQGRWSFRAETVWPGDADPFAVATPEPASSPRTETGPGWTAVVRDPDATDRVDVLAAAQRRADALVSGDPDNLTHLLHPRFTWTSHRGDVLDRSSYVRGNTDGTLRWLEQRLEDAVVRLVGTTAVVTGVVHDRVVRDGAELSFTLPVTQTWVRDDGRWRCLAGHAGPLG